jgi:hypothetical protein
MTTLAALLAVAGTLAVAVATAGQQRAPSPLAAATGVARTPSHSGNGPDTNTGTRGIPPTSTQPQPTTTGPLLARSAPLTLTVPKLGIRSTRLVRLGLAADGSIQVPPTGKNSPAGWFTGSPTPGQLGPAVLLGHVDSAEAGPAIFFRLGALRPGDTATVRRSDGTDAVFTVDRVEEYAKTTFPTLRVFGNTTRAELRLITCGGHFDPHLGSYEDNIVVFARLTSTHPA